jgi:hypothetical protein
VRIDVVTLVDFHGDRDLDPVAGPHAISRRVAFRFDHAFAALREYNERQ